MLRQARLLLESIGLMIHYTHQRTVDGKATALFTFLDIPLVRTITINTQLLRAWRSWCLNRGHLIYFDLVRVTRCEKLTSRPPPSLPLSLSLPGCVCACVSSHFCEIEAEC